MGIKTRLSITARLVVLPAALLGLLAGCTSNPSENESTGNDQPSGTPTTSVASPAHDLQSAVLTTAELPTGGWTLDADTSTSTGETSTDKGEADLCQGDLSGYFDIGPDAGASNWTRAETDATLAISVSPDDASTDHIRGVAEDLRGCPTQTTFTQNGQTARASVTSKDLGTWGDESLCMGLELQQSGMFPTGTVCVAAVDDYLVSVLTLSVYSFNAPADDETAQIMRAEVDKAAQSLTKSD
ncbi:hypothetical protein IFT90_15380 [Frigoribacterium sp. CFBP 8766]|uniref:hypothetical protein n=1 Tax=Frigoribacterium sp. CFBP 8766 TaxID=2775273 RepID=UPI00178155D1|nr:hypothetical protein [Frigoribacterium sp. CFBP 8766]MBD8585936.1 hypothetical protein [Frigoribacterium sp. CFBP 8766]